MFEKCIKHQTPPYPIFGGLVDAMKEAGGDVLLATNQEAKEAAKLFLETEGNDIHAASAVATATLIAACKNGTVNKDAIVMLNITGGGEEKLKAEKELYYLKPLFVFDMNPDSKEIQQKVASLFASV